MDSNHDDIVRRLHALAEQPVDPDLAARHAPYLAPAARPVRRSRMRPLLAGSLVAGALLGGTGMAAALTGTSLPEKASSVAKAALAAVNLADDDDAKDAAAEAAKEAAEAAKEAREAAKKTDADDEGDGVERFLTGCTAGTPPTAFTGTHGEYVSAHPDLESTPDVNERQVAAHSDCGKPLVAVQNRAAAEARSEGAGKPDDAGGGRPESPGNSGQSQGATQRAAHANGGQSAEHRPTTTTTTTTTTTP